MKNQEKRLECPPISAEEESMVVQTLCTGLSDVLKFGPWSDEDGSAKQT
jgi:hypothetical protein